jgi:hypothetical protein
LKSKIFIVISLLCLGHLANAQLERGNKRILTLDDVLACTSGPTAKLLGQSVDKIREADHSSVLRLENGIIIHWSMSGDKRPAFDLSDQEEHSVESPQESGFCRIGKLKLLHFDFLSDRYLEVTTGKLADVPSGGSPPTSDEKTRWIPLSESKLFVTEIYRYSDGYEFSPQQVYGGNHAFSQKQGVFTNSDEHYLLITLDPAPCSLTLRDTSGDKTVVPVQDRSKVGVSLQWIKGKQGHWDFYRAMYETPGCPES